MATLSGTLSVERPFSMLWLNFSFPFSSELIMYPPHQHHPKRRKKRPIHGVKTVDVTRGKSGYGFTISGQHPCVLSCIVNNSPADRVGLRPGDYLMSVNGQDVSKFGHDEVVRMVGLSTGTLTIQVAENYNSSDSSDDEYHPRTKNKYPSRNKRSQRYGEKMEKLLSDINQRDRYCPDGHSHDPNSRPLPKADLPKSRTSRPRLHTPVGAENHEILSEGRSLIEAGGGVFKVPFQKSASASNVPAASHLPLQRVEPKQAFIKSTSQGLFKSVSHSGQPSRGVDNHMYSNFSPTSLQQIINHSLNSYSAANEAFILNDDDCDEADDDEQLSQNGGVIKIIVGYIGSLEMPGDANQPHVRIQSIRNAVRRLRVEQKIHTLVLMTVSVVGVKLTNMYGTDIALYPVKRLAFSGVCPDDRRFFGIVTLNKTEGDGDDSSGEESPRNAGSSSCHVFMVDPEMTAHNAHAQKAKNFGIVCTVDQQTQRCLEFPRSTTPVILSISNLYKDRPGGTVSNDVARSQVFANPNQPVERRSSSSSNSDSGLGLGREDNSTERIAAADIPPPPIPQRQPQLPQIKWSGNTIHLTQGPIRHLTPRPDPEAVPHHRSSKSSLKSPLSSNALDLDMSLSNEKTSNEDLTKSGDKFNIRAMPNPVSLQTGSRGHLHGDGLEQQNAAENLRKLLQAQQKLTGLDQTSSDTESRSSRSDGMLSTANLGQRPVSAPFKYLSTDSSSDLKYNTLDSTTSRMSNHISDSNIADKLSPRAFLSSAFTPVGSVGSAFKKVRSRPSLNQLRSPSAPPIPSYHGDDEASDEEEMKGLIARFEKDKSFGLSSGDSEPRRYSEGHALSRKVGNVFQHSPNSYVTVFSFIMLWLGSIQRHRFTSD